jgi:hypothetical protein
MTESEWLTCTDPQPMLELLRGKASDRKLRLFAVACCRRIWHLLTDEPSRRAVEEAERVDEGVRAAELELAFANAFASCLEAAESSLGQFAAEAAAHTCEDDAMVAAEWASQTAAQVAAHEQGGLTLSHSVASVGVLADLLRGARAKQCDSLRDIFGNPFHPLPMDPAWLTPPVTQFASAIYDTRAFVRMPALADALEQAGCHDLDILAHCRQSGEHFLGNWLLDLLLGKE